MKPCPIPTPPGYWPCRGERGHAGLHDFPTMAEELRARIDRTLDYTDSLLRLPDLASDLVVVLMAVHNSLCTPIATPQCAEDEYHEGRDGERCYEPGCREWITGASDFCEKHRPPENTDQRHAECCRAGNPCTWPLPPENTEDHS